MDDNDLVRAELAVHGITVGRDGVCLSTRGGKEVRCSVDEQITRLRASVRENKGLVVSVWDDMLNFVVQREVSPFAGSRDTQRLFVHSVKMLYKASRRFRSLGKARMALKAILNEDSENFPESFMSRVVEYGLGFHWVHHLVREDLYRIDLLRHLAKPATKTAGGYTSPGYFTVPDRERVWEISEDEEEGRAHDNSGNTRTTPNEKRELDPVDQFWQRRHSLPETYNDPYSFEEGFVWRELRNDPYEFDDKDENPYPATYQRV